MLSRRELLAVVPAACLPSFYLSAPARLVAVPFREAEALFHSDPRWLGGDGVYSIDLGGGRILWLFGDSFVGTSAKRLRSESAMPRNTLAIQTGRDPARASMKFYWREGPSAFFPCPRSGRWYWPGHGAALRSGLVVFLSEQRPSTEGLGFEVTGWAAVLVDNPAEPPNEWKPQPLATSDPFGIVVGASALVQGGHLYAYGTKGSRSHLVYLCRWPLSSVSHRDLSNPEWFVGHGWKLQSQMSDVPFALFADGQTEFNIVPDRAHGSQVIVQTVGFGSSPLAYRTARRLTGPWSEAQKFYDPPEMGRPHGMIYSAKVHPAILAPGADFVVSYSTNSMDFRTLLADPSLYYPRFLKASWRS